LRRLHTNSGKLDVDENAISREATEIKHTVDEEREAAAGNSFKTLLKDGTQKFRYRTLLGIGGQFMQQLSGKWTSMSNDRHLTSCLYIVQG
jgi:hypothetical protein